MGRLSRSVAALGGLRRAARLAGSSNVAQPAFVRSLLPVPLPWLPLTRLRPPPILAAKEFFCCFGRGRAAAHRRGRAPLRSLVHCLRIIKAPKYGW
jgi:hypothetical protein